MAKSDFQVGQIVYAPKSSGGYREYTISKVGRKWIHVNNSRRRFDADTLQMDNGGYGGQVYRSPEAHMAEAELYQAWRTFGSDVQRTSFRHVSQTMTLETIAAARKLLGL